MQNPDLLAYGQLAAENQNAGKRHFLMYLTYRRHGFRTSLEQLSLEGRKKDTFLEASPGDGYQPCNLA